MNHNFALPLSESQRGYQSHKTETMVGMKMRKKNVSDFGLRYLPLEETSLRTFPAIDQKQIASEIDHLGGRQMSQGRLSRPATEYFDTESIHF